MLKFRVPVTEYDTGKFVRFLYETLDCGIFMFNENMREFPNSLVIGKEERCTGKEDKNGYEIYENDYFKNGSGEINKVIWHDEAFIISDLREKEVGLYYVLLGECSKGCIELIGNDRENPELING